MSWFWCGVTQRGHPTFFFFFCSYLLIHHICWVSRALIKIWGLVRDSLLTLSGFSLVLGTTLTVLIDSFGGSFEILVYYVFFSSDFFFIWLIMVTLATGWFSLFLDFTKDIFIKIFIFLWLRVLEESGKWAGSVWAPC